MWKSQFGQVRVSTGVARDPSRSRQKFGQTGLAMWLYSLTNRFSKRRCWDLPKQSRQMVTHQPVAIARRFARAPDSNQASQICQNASESEQMVREYLWGGLAVYGGTHQGIAFSLRNTSPSEVSVKLSWLTWDCDWESVCWLLSRRRSNRSGYPGAGTSNRWRTYLPQPQTRFALGIGGDPGSSIANSR